MAAGLDNRLRMSSGTGARIAHIPALDGIRGLAVIAVIVYHGDVGALTGGFIGVDLFFVLSGFLITSLLLNEHDKFGRVDLSRFWIRRFRRLLPAVLVFLTAVALWSWIAADPTTLRDIRNGALAGLAYVSNWFFVLSGVSYGMEWSAPSPVLHLWSLSVEEQYYVVWPLVAGWLLSLGVRRRVPGRRVFLVFGLGAVAVSTVWMLVLGATGATKDRMYFGTDTRMATILVGVALAALLQPVVARRGADGEACDPGRARLAGLLGSGGALFLVFVALTSNEKDPWLYVGGFTLVALACAAVIAAAVTHPASDRILGSKPLEWVGTRSYGLYLWHWGVIVALAVAAPGFTGWPRLAVAVVVTGTIAELSYRLVENPIRTGSFKLPVPRVAVPTSFAVVAALLMLGTHGAEDLPDYLRERTVDDIEIVEPSSTQPPATQPHITAAPDTSPPGAPVPDTSAPATAPPATPKRVALVGDSVAASLADALEAEFTSRGIAFANASAPGCGVLDGDPADDRGQILQITSKCSAAIPDLQRNVVDKADPDLVVVLSSWEAGDRVVDGVWHPFGSAEADSQLLDLYRRTIDRVTSGGARAALVTIADNVDSKRGPADGDKIRRLRHMNGVLEQVVQRDPARASLVRLDKIVCPDDPCPKVVGGIELRATDGAHFADRDAAAFVARELVDRIVGVAPGSPG